MLKSVEGRGATVRPFYEVEKVDIGAGQFQVLLLFSVLKGAVTFLSLTMPVLVFV